jgi:hypothetical protein
VLLLLSLAAAGQALLLLCLVSAPLAFLLLCLLVAIQQDLFDLS